MVAVPAEIVANARHHPLLQGLLPTKIGFFPAAEDHRHECSEKMERVGFMYCSKGRGWCEMRGRVHAVQAGSLLVSPPDEVYAHGADAQDPWTISWFQVVGGEVASLLSELSVTAEQPLLQVGGDPYWRVLFDEALDTLEKGQTTAHLVHSAHTLGHLLSATMWRRRQCVAAPDPRGRIEQCVQFMRQNLSQPLTLSALAGMANMSPARFKLHFKRHTGVSCIGYFIRLRIEHACHLLETTELSVKAIADQVGYADPLWFSKAFHAEKKLPPSEYRRRFRG